MITNENRTTSTSLGVCHQNLNTLWCVVKHPNSPKLHTSEIYEYLPSSYLTQLWIDDTNDDFPIINMVFHHHLYHHNMGEITWNNMIHHHHVYHHLDVGQNGRPLMGPQMWMSSLVLTIHNFGVPNFDPYPFVSSIYMVFLSSRRRSSPKHGYSFFPRWKKQKKEDSKDSDQSEVHLMWGLDP